VDKLFSGVIDFYNTEYKSNKKLFETLAEKQQPHTLFIGCSDSRVVPNLITKTLPGELFVIRNIANVVPPYTGQPEDSCTTSAIEYAVNILNVENVVVCGHSNCGGCKALYMDEELQSIPNTKKWLQLAQEAKKAALNILSQHKDYSDKELATLTEKENIKLQLQNLLTYPFIQSKLEKKAINIYGWYYIIKTGEVYNYSFEKNDFEKVNGS